MPDLITEDLVVLDMVVADRYEAVRDLGERLVAAGRVTDLDGFLVDLRKREEQMPTGLPGGIGIPHCRSQFVRVPTMAFARSDYGVDFGAEDGPASLIFLIAAPDGGADLHLQILAALARRLMRPNFRQSLLDAPTAADVAKIINHEVLV